MEKVYIASPTYSPPEDTVIEENDISNAINEFFKHHQSYSTLKYPMKVYDLLGELEKKNREKALQYKDYIKGKNFIYNQIIRKYKEDINEFKEYAVRFNDHRH